MARMARLVVPHYPHHVTQRGNRRQQTFFCVDDYRRYIRLLAEAKADAGVEFWGYCLMPNHVHLIAVPARKDSLARLFRHAHLRYTRSINKRHGWSGHLWQERFHSFVMDEPHLLAAVRYAELNPVRASLCRRPEDWQWSSCHAFRRGDDDSLVTVKPMLALVGGWDAYLQAGLTDEQLALFRRHSRTGRPVGSEAFIRRLEIVTGRVLRKKRTGPKARRYRLARR